MIGLITSRTTRPPAARCTRSRLATTGRSPTTTSRAAWRWTRPASGSAGAGPWRYAGTSAASASTRGCAGSGRHGPGGSDPGHWQMAKSTPVQPLDALRRDLLAKHDWQHLSWREIARRHYPGVPAGTLCAIAKGREPKGAGMRTRLGLPALGQAPVCTACGRVHVADTCTAHKPASANGAAPVTVWAHRVRPGAVVVGRSRKCARRRCRVFFVGAPGQRYCSDACRDRVRLWRRRRERTRLARGRKARR